MGLGFIVTVVLSILTVAKAGSYSYSNFNGIIKCTASADLIAPRNTSEAAATVKAATAAGQNVRVITPNKWSITDVICPDAKYGLALSMENFKQLSYDSQAQTVTVGTGWRVADLIEEMASLYDVSFIHLPSFGSITVGGAISTGAHGSSLKHVSSLADQIVGLEVIHSDGSIQSITDPVALNHYRVALGSLGVITTVTFSVVPLFKVQWSTSQHPEAILTDGTIFKLAEQVDGIYAYWNPYKKSVAIATMEYVDVTVPGDDYWNYIPEVDAVTRVVQKTILDALQATNQQTLLCENENALHRRLTSNSGLYSLIAPYFKDVSTGRAGGTQVASINGTTCPGLRATGYSHRMLASSCVDCPFSQPNGVFFNDFGIDLPIENFVDAIKFSRSVMATFPVCFPLSDILIRFRKSSNITLSGSYGGVYATIEWDTTHRSRPLIDPELNLAAVQWLAQGYLLNYGGRSHWGKTGNFPFYNTPNSIPTSTALYPRLGAFLEYQAAIDPNGTFRNDFFKSALLDDPAVVHNKTYNRCALVYDCICSQDSHCGASQKCITQPLANGNVAKLCVDRNWNATS